VKVKLIPMRGVAALRKAGELQVWQEECLTARYDAQALGDGGHAVRHKKEDAYE